VVIVGDDGTRHYVAIEGCEVHDPLLPAGCSLSEYPNRGWRVQAVVKTRPTKCFTRPGAPYWFWQGLMGLRRPPPVSCSARRNCVCIRSGTMDSGFGMIVQLPLSPPWGTDDEWAVRGQLREALENLFKSQGCGQFDGADFGSGTTNFFIYQVPESQW